MSSLTRGLFLIPLAFLSAGMALASAPRSPISVSLKLTYLDSGSRAGEIEAEVVSLEEADDTKVTLLLPPGATADPTEWVVDLKPGEPVSIRASFVLGEVVGNTEVRVLARKEWSSNDSWGQMQSVPIHVDTIPGTKLADVAYQGWTVDLVPVATLDEAGSAPVLSDESLPFKFPDRSDGPAPSESVPSTVPLRPGEKASAPPEQATTVTLTGRWRYTDRSNVTQDADQQLIEVVRSNGTRIGGGVFCYTDTDGTFSCPFAHPGTDLRVYLRSRTVFGSATGDVQLGVYSGVNITGGCGSDSVDCTYPVQTGVIQCADGSTCNIGTWSVTSAQGEPWHGAMQMTQDLIRSYKRILFDSLHPGAPHSGSGRISYPANTGPVFERGGTNDRWISIPSPYQTSADVVLHEYGHAAMYNLWAGMSPSWPTSDCPSPHIIQNTSGPGCALSEGFADFWPLYSNQYYDGDNSSANDGPTYDDPGFTVDFENFAPNNNGDQVEGNYAAALWDMHDTANEGTNNATGTDRMGDGIAHIWHSVSAFSADNVAGWWADYKSSASHDQGPALSALKLNTIDYGYVANDICENANVIHLPYNNAVSTLQATTDSIEPPVNCGNSSRQKSVWYSIVDSVPRIYHVTTFGSSYDTILQAYVGSCGNLTPVSGGCNDDAAGGVQSELVLQSTPGQTIYFMATSYSGGGGSLAFFLEIWDCIGDSHCDPRVFCRTSRCDLSSHQCVTIQAPCDDGDACTQDTCIDSRALCINAPDPLLDPDGDGVCATLDGCPTIFDPGQSDFDGDGQGNACDLDDDNDLVDDSADCASLDPTAWGIPLEVSQVEATPVPFALLWDSLAADLGPGMTYDVLRGDLAAFPVGSTIAESCLGATPMTQIQDGTDPPPGSGLWYLVRPRNACGTGSYGFASDGTERRSQQCP